MERKSAHEVVIVDVGMSRSVMFRNAYVELSVLAMCSTESVSSSSVLRPLSSA